MMKIEKFAWRRRSFLCLAPKACLAGVVVCAGWIVCVPKVVSAAPSAQDDALYRFAQAQAKDGGEAVGASSSLSLSSSLPSLPSLPSSKTGKTDKTDKNISLGGTTDFSGSTDHNIRGGAGLPLPAIERLALGQPAVGKLSGSAVFAKSDDVEVLFDGGEVEGRSGGIVVGNKEGGGKFSKNSSGMGFSWMINTLGALGVVIGLILAFRALLLRMNGQAAVGSARGAIEVLGRVSVAPRQHVLLLKVGQRVLLVGESANGLRTLDTIVDPEEVADVLTRVTARQVNSATVGFSQMLSRFHGQFDDQGDSKDEGGDRGEYLVDRARDQVMNVLGRVRSMHTQFRKETP